MVTSWRYCSERRESLTFLEVLQIVTRTGRVAGVVSMAVDTYRRVNSKLWRVPGQRDDREVGRV